MSASPARKIAFEILTRVETEDAYASDALHSALNATIKPADAALATELTMGVLRWRAQLDFLLAVYLKKPVSKLDSAVAIALRLGLYQLRHLERIPARVAVHESVELVKQARKTSAGSLVNAVLRKAVNETRRPAADFLPVGLATTERLAILHSHPIWLIERWLKRFGEAHTISLLETNNQPPRLSCAIANPAQHVAILEELARENLHIEPGRLLQNAFSASGGSISRTKAFREGRITIQDEASQAVPLLLQTQPGDHVLDLCAAPGGKTTILARAASTVVAADLHAHRLRAAKSQFARLHLNNIELIALDATQPLPFSTPFDRILVDAPCSGTGTLARHPEIRWRLKPQQLAEFHRLQVSILRNAIAQADPGAAILYSTCSMESEENEEVVAEALKEENTRKIRRATQANQAATIRPYLSEAIDTKVLIEANGSFRTFPPRDHTDGFFAALLQIEK